MSDNFRERFSLDYLLPTADETQRKEPGELFDRLSKAADQETNPALKTELKVIAALGREKIKNPPRR